MASMNELFGRLVAGYVSGAGALFTAAGYMLPFAASQLTQTADRGTE